MNDDTVEPRQDQADQSALVDQVAQMVDGAAAQIVRTILRPLLPGGYDLVRYSRRTLVGTAGVGGACTVQLDGIEPGYVYFVDRLGLVANTGTWAQVAVYSGPASGGALVDISTAGSPDVSIQENPLVVGPEGLTLVAAGMTNGAQLAVTVLYRLGRALGGEL